MPSLNHRITCSPIPVPVRECVLTEEGFCQLEQFIQKQQWQSSSRRCAKCWSLPEYFMSWPSYVFSKFSQNANNKYMPRASQIKRMYFLHGRPTRISILLFPMTSQPLSLLFALPIHSDRISKTFLILRDRHMSYAWQDFKVRAPQHLATRGVILTTCLQKRQLLCQHVTCSLTSRANHLVCLRAVLTSVKVHLRFLLSRTNTFGPRPLVYSSVHASSVLVFSCFWPGLTSDLPSLKSTLGHCWWDFLVQLHLSIY